MDTITISMVQVENSASQIRNINKQLQGNLQDIHVVMQQLSGFWQSPASDTIRQRFSAMLPTFENYRIIIDTYATFLDQTVSTYLSIESQINTNADTFK